MVPILILALTGAVRGEARRYRDVVQKVLTLVREGDTWRIAAEASS